MSCLSAAIRERERERENLWELCPVCQQQLKRERERELMGKDACGSYWLCVRACVCVCGYLCA